MNNAAKNFDIFSNKFEAPTSILMVQQNYFQICI